MEILFLSSEAVPFAKTGGLADVSGVLPQVLAKSEKVTLMIPGYATDSIHRLQATPVDVFTMAIGKSTYRAVIKKTAVSPNFSVFFVFNDDFFNRDFLYGDSSGDYPDNFIRFFFFQKSVMEWMGRQRRRFDIIHCNDWQTAMVPMFIRMESSASPYFNSQTVFSIHNLGYQGIFSSEHFADCGLPSHLFSPEYLEFFGKLNCMKAGIIFSDQLLTVSPTYAREILLAENGFGLDGLLRKFSYKLSGIMNGVDYASWDPEIDSFLAHHYTEHSLGMKEENKKGLFAELGIRYNGRTPLIIMISRISEQKGMDLLIKTLPSLLQEEIHFILLGMGDLSWTKGLKDMAARFSNKMTFLNRFDERMAHLLEAAADILFMPSLYEPCGLNQIFSMKYGTVPIVRATGGLMDSVQEFDPHSGTGTGFRFSGHDAGAVMAVMKRALHFFSDIELWRKIQKNGMEMDFSWDRVAPMYLELYKKTLTEDTCDGRNHIRQ